MTAIFFNNLNIIKRFFFYWTLNELFWKFLLQQQLCTAYLFVWRLSLVLNIVVKCLNRILQRSNVVVMEGVFRGVSFFIMIYNVEHICCIWEITSYRILYFLIKMPLYFKVDCLRNLKKISSVVEILLKGLLENSSYFKVFYKSFISTFQSFVKFFNMILINVLIKLIGVFFFFFKIHYIFYGSNKNNILYYNSRSSKINRCWFSDNRFSRCGSWYWYSLRRLDSWIIEKSSFLGFIVSLCYFRFRVNRSNGFVSDYDGVFNFEQLNSWTLLNSTLNSKIAFLKFLFFKNLIWLFQDGSLFFKEQSVLESSVKAEYYKSSRNFYNAQLFKGGSKVLISYV